MSKVMKFIEPNIEGTGEFLSTVKGVPRGINRATLGNVMDRFVEWGNELGDLTLDSAKYTMNVVNAPNKITAFIRLNIGELFTVGQMIRSTIGHSSKLVEEVVEGSVDAVEYLVLATKYAIANTIGKVPGIGFLVNKLVDVGVGSISILTNTLRSVPQVVAHIRGKIGGVVNRSFKAAREAIGPGTIIQSSIMPGAYPKASDQVAPALLNQKKAANDDKEASEHLRRAA